MHRNQEYFLLIDLIDFFGELHRFLTELPLDGMSHCLDSLSISYVNTHTRAHMDTHTTRMTQLPHSYARAYARGRCVLMNNIRCCTVHCLSSRECIQCARVRARVHRRKQDLCQRPFSLLVAWSMRRIATPISLFVSDLMLNNKSIHLLFAV